MDFYLLLGLERGATLNEIKRAYKRLARRYHPDINPGDRLAVAQFRQIAEAYETLERSRTARRYDVHGPTVEADGQTFGFEGFDFSVSVEGTGAPTFGDLFADVFRQRAARAERMERGADLHHTIDLTFEEALAGGAHAVTVTREVSCRACHGAGRVAVAETRCAHCQGSGIVKSARGHMVFSKPCPQCAGQGRHRQTVCPACGGRRFDIRTESLTVSVPAGLADGARVRVRRRAHGPDGAEPDLTITLRVQPHPLFTREGDDLHATIPIGIHEAALGAKIDVPAPDGSVRVRGSAGDADRSAVSRPRPRRGIAARADAAIWSSKRESSCLGSSTSVRRSCCASSGASTAVPTFVHR
jgi:molecular chaperone DnaJ